MSWYDSAIAGWYRSKIASADAMASGIEQLGGAISKAIEGVRQNQIANQIGSQEANSGAYAPRAGLVSPGTNPDTGEENQIPDNVPTQGTAPAKFTGGYQGLQLQNAVDSLRLRNQNFASENALRQAQAGYYGAHTDYLNRQSDINQQRADTYQQRVEQKGNPPDTMAKLNSEIKAAYGKDAPTVLSSLINNPNGSRGDVKNVNGQDVWVPNPNGSVFSPNAPKPNPASGGLFGIGAHGEEPQPMTGKEIQIPWTQAQKYLDRYNSISSGSQQPQGNQNQPGATPVQIRNAADYQQLPSGSTYIDPNGVQRVKP